MLINLSNHPSVNWSKEQMERAITQFGSIEDMAFPNVPPDATTEQVNELAKSFLEKILEKILQTMKNTPSVTAVHLMGEMTFIVSLTRLLQQANIKVVCSTTERIVLAEIDGKKTMQFQFCQFREYPAFEA